MSLKNIKQNKVVFCGVKNIGLLALRTFVEISEVCIVITTNHKDNKKILDLSDKLNIPVYIDPDFKNINFINDIKRKKINTAVSVSYPKIIPEIFFKIFKNGMLNFHPAKLPNYRGCYPTLWPILYSDEFAYYTLHIIDKGIDTGPILKEIKIKINNNDTGWSLYQRLEKKLPSFIKTSSSIMFSENKKILIQEEEYANYYTKKIPNNGLIDFSWKGSYIVNFIRALYSPIHLSAYIIVDEKIIEIMSAKYLSFENDIKNDYKKNSLFECSDGYVVLKSKLV